MSRYCYKSSLTSFLSADKDEWISSMKAGFAQNSSLPLGQSQISAWKDCFGVLKRELVELAEEYQGFDIIFEYILPYESGRRPDVILISKEQVIILEFKMKNVVFAADMDQCIAYARDIREYHFESRDKEVVGILVLTKTKDVLYLDNDSDTYVCSGDKLGEFLRDEVVEASTACDSDKWVDSAYEPLPTIVSAAKMFMNNTPLPNIKRVNSTGIPKAIDCLSEIAEDAKKNSKHVIAFVTGVPGAGKTFLGLKYVYDINHLHRLFYLWHAY